MGSMSVLPFFLLIICHHVTITSKLLSKFVSRTMRHIDILQAFFALVVHVIYNIIAVGYSFIYIAVHFVKFLAFLPKCLFWMTSSLRENF